MIGHYLPGRWREFVYRDPDGAHWVHLAHPNGQAIKRLRVILASVDASYAGLIGLDAMPISLEGTAKELSFVLSGSTGNLRRNDTWDLLGDQLMCVYPQPDLKLEHAENYPLPGYAGATNNQMELLATIEALTALVTRRAPVNATGFRKAVIWTDATYLVEGYDSARFIWQTHETRP